MSLVRVRKRAQGREILKNDKIWWCPACKKKHKVDKRWALLGTILKPTLEPDFIGKGIEGKAGIMLEGHTIKSCHCKIKDGKIHYYPDSEHDFAGKVVDMVDIDYIEKYEAEHPLQFDNLDPQSLYGRYAPGKYVGLVSASMKDMR